MMSVALPFRDWLKYYKILKKTSLARSWLLVGCLIAWLSGCLVA